MKFPDIALLKSVPTLSKRDVLLVVVPALIWGLSNSLQSRIIKTPCDHRPEACQAADLFWFDRFVVPMDSQRAADISNRTQDFSGFVSVAVISGAVMPTAGFFSAAADLTVLLETLLWNGAVTETTRVIAQRPRPYVYREPLRHAGSPAHYTSFYSGHTSFVASITLGLLFVLMGRGFGRTPLRVAFGFSLVMTVLTGALRMLGGKHFTSDVVVGALAGAAVAWWVAWLHRRTNHTLKARSALIP